MRVEQIGEGETHKPSRAIGGCSFAMFTSFGGGLRFETRSSPGSPTLGCIGAPVWPLNPYNFSGIYTAFDSTGHPLLAKTDENLRRMRSTSIGSRQKHDHVSSGPEDTPSGRSWDLVPGPPLLLSSQREPRVLGGNGRDALAQ